MPSTVCASSAIPGCLTTRAAPLSVCAWRSRRAMTSGAGASFSSCRIPWASPSRRSRASTRKYLYGSFAIRLPVRLGLNQPHQVPGKVGELGRCLERLARAGLCLLGRLRDVGHGDVNLLDRRRLLLRAELDLSSRLGGRAHEAYDLPEGCCDVRELTRARVNRLGAALGGHHGGIYGGADLIDEPADLLGGTPDAVGELTDFVGDHGETLEIGRAHV